MEPFYPGLLDGKSHDKGSADFSHKLRRNWPLSIIVAVPGMLMQALFRLSRRLGIYREYHAIILFFLFPDVGWPTLGYFDIT